MRPPTKSNRFFYHPLDKILGREAAVRILRMLSLSDHAWSPPTIAWRCQLGRPGTARALARLLAARVIEHAGGHPPRFPYYRLAHNTPLANALRDLFERERRLGKPARRTAVYSPT